MRLPAKPIHKNAPTALVKQANRSWRDECGLRIINSQKNIRLALRDITGKILMEKNYGTLGGSQLLPINTSNLASGLYMIEILSGNERYSKKLLVK